MNLIGIKARKASEIKINTKIKNKVLNNYALLLDKEKQSILRQNKKDVKLLYTDISKPLILCGITTSITFLCLFFIKSDALNDLGIFASISVLSTTFFSLTIIPFLYYLGCSAISH